MTAPTLDQSAVGPLPAHLMRRGDPDAAFDDYFSAITYAIVEHPRSKQRAIGPSEVGDPCARRLAYHRWEAAGKIAAFRTVGGQRRFARAEIERIRAAV